MRSKHSKTNLEFLLSFNKVRGWYWAVIYLNEENSKVYSELLNSGHSSDKKAALDNIQAAITEFVQNELNGLGS